MNDPKSDAVQKTDAMRASAQSDAQRAQVDRGSRDNQTGDRDRPGQKAEPKFVFVGDPNDNYSGPNVLTVKDVRFIKNKATKVPPEQEAFFAKHTHFLTPDKAEKLLKQLAEQQSHDDNDDFEDDPGSPVRRRVAAPGRPARGEAPKGPKGNVREAGNYDSMTMAQLHMEVAEQSKTAPGNATKEELIAILNS